MREARRPRAGGVTFGCVERVGCGAEAEMWCQAREYASFVCVARWKMLAIELCCFCYDGREKEMGEKSLPAPSSATW